MDKQLIEWINFCEGKVDFDISHFYTLFFEGDADNGYRSDVELDAIFKYFRNSEDLKLRLRNTTQTIDLEEPDDMATFLIDSTFKDVQEKKKFIDDEELLKFLAKPVNYIDDIESVRKSQITDWQYEEYMALVGDTISELKYSTEKKVYALFEAFYGLTTDYNMVWYLGRPLLKTTVNLDHYFDLWRFGGRYCISSDGILVSRYR